MSEAVNSSAQAVASGPGHVLGGNQPSLGRIVLYHEGDHEAGRYYEGDSARHWHGTNGHREHPAIITAVWSPTCVNLMVFFDAAGPQVRTSQCELPDSAFADDVHCSQSGYRWPRRT